MKLAFVSIHQYFFPLDQCMISETNCVGFICAGAGGGSMLFIMRRNCGRIFFFLVKIEIPSRSQKLVLSSISKFVCYEG